jgi:hypothetical protein
MAGGGGTGVETVGREAALEKGGGQSRVGVEGVDERARSRFERLGRRRGREGKKRERRGGGSSRGSATWCGMTSWGLALTGGRRHDRVPAGRDPDATCAGGASLFGEQRAGTDRVGPGGRESGEARVARGPAREESAGPSPDKQ